MAGILLWFAGVRLSQKFYVELVQEFFEELSKRNTWGGLSAWPGPIAKLLLNQIDETLLISDVCENKDAKESQLCQVNFAIAIKNFQKKEFIKYRKYMKASSSSHKACLMGEYYLAKYEKNIKSNKFL